MYHKGSKSLLHCIFFSNYFVAKISC